MACGLVAVILYLATSVSLIGANEYLSVQTGHPNTNFCGRIAGHIGNDQESFHINDPNYRQSFRINDPLNCFSFPDTYVQNITRDTLDGEKKFDVHWGRCFDFTLNRTVNGWSDEDAALCGSVTVDGKGNTNVWCYYDLLRKVFCAAFVNSDTTTDDERPEMPLHCGFELSSASGYGFDTDPTNLTTWKETIYLKGGSCDNREWEHEDIMFEDMTDLDLQSYNEEFVGHLTCPLLENLNATVDDDRITRVEFKICQPNYIDKGVCYCAYHYPDEFHETLLVGARVESLLGVSPLNGNDYLGLTAQRQQNEQVCISYQTDIVFLSTCFSFCMNIGEETNVMIGNEAMKFRISDSNIEKNATSFSTVQVKIFKRNENGNIIGEYEGYSDDARYDFGNDDNDDTRHNMHGHEQSDDDGSTFKIRGKDSEEDAQYNTNGNTKGGDDSDSKLHGDPNDITGNAVLLQWLLVISIVVGLVFLCFLWRWKHSSSNDEMHSPLPKADGYAKVVLADLT